MCAPNNKGYVTNREGRSFDTFTLPKSISEADSETDGNLSAAAVSHRLSRSNYENVRVM